MGRPPGSRQNPLGRKALAGRSRRPTFRWKWGRARSGFELLNLDGWNHQPGPLHHTDLHASGTSRSADPRNARDSTHNRPG